MTITSLINELLTWTHLQLEVPGLDCVLPTVMSLPQEMSIM